MATTAMGDGEETPTCARDFVVERLQEADSPMSPSELAEEYGCTNGHVRSLMTDLVRDGEVKRVRHGEYVPTDGEDDEGDSEAQEEQHEVGEQDSGNEGETTDGEPQEPITQSAVSPAGGGRQSEDLDTDEIEDDEVAGIPLPVSKEVLVVGLVLVLLVVYWRSQQGGSGQPDQAAEQDEEDGFEAPPVDGLVGGD